MERGITLVELMIYVVLLSISLTALYNVLISNIRAYDSTETSLMMHQDLRTAMLMMERDIRMAGCDPTGILGNLTGILQDTSSSSVPSVLHVNMDIYGAGSTTAAGDDVTYSVDANNNLIRNAIYPTTNGLFSRQILATNVIAIQFIAYDQNNNIVQMVHTGITPSTADSKI
jgi:Tfp pilus assembly protein PilW